MSETKQVVFKVSFFLVSIDGPDGAGKSNFTQVLVSKLKTYLGDDRIELIKPSYFDVSSGSQRVGQKLASLEGKFRPHSRLHNNFFLAAMTVNYRNVILPAIRSGKIIILDSSEIRALAFMIDKGSPDAVRDTITRIQKGVLACGIQPKIRVILEGNPEDLYRSLSTKNSLDSGDPRGIQEIERRIEAYQKAISLIRQLKVSEPVDWRIINTCHVNGSLQEYFSNLIDQARIIPALVNRIRT